MSAFRLCLIGLVFGCVLTGPAWGLGGGPDRPRGTLSAEARATWAPLLSKGTTAGIPADQLESTLFLLDRAGLTVTEGGTALAPAIQAAHQGLPADSVLQKLEEGILKGASSDALRAAAETRRLALVKAQQMLTAREFSDTGPDSIVATALALESGVPEASVDAVLVRGRGGAPGRILEALEAGEALHLAGLDPESVEVLMLDCFDRNLRRTEILRMVRFAQEQTRAGMDGRAVRTALWGRGNGAGSRGGATRGMMGPSAGDGAGAGGTMMGPGGQSGSGGHRGGPR